MAKNPYFTVVIPLYNCQEFIGETIDSVLNQTFSDWEMIVIDDASTDNSREVVKEYVRRDPRVSLVELESGFGGPAGPRNIGISKAKSPYIALLDSDDIWHPEKLATQNKILSECNDISMVHTGSYEIDEESRLIGTFPSDRPSQKIVNRCLTTILGAPKRELFGNTINTNTLIYRREIALQVPFDESPEIASIEDWHQRIEILMQFPDIKIVKINEPLISYRIRSGSISAHGKDQQPRKAIFMYCRFYLAKKINWVEFCVGVFISLIGILRIRIRSIFFRKNS